MKKILAFLTSVVLIITLTACSNGNSDVSNQGGQSKPQNTKDYITLLYSQSDSFNPYEAITETNRQLAKLLFEPLVKIDNNFNAVYSLAKSVKTEGSVCTVVLRDATFSDGTPLTADDVVYSYNAAIKADGIYAAKLYAVKNVTASSNDTVIFDLTKADPYFVNLLDFPILKAGSDKLIDEDSVKLIPIGAGRYVFNSDNTELVLNKKYYGEQGDIKKIRLINAPDSESVAHYVEVGAADIYFNDISDGEIIRMSGQKFDINLNNLVYIGVNHSYGDLALSGLRQAISTGVSRMDICSDAYYNNALAATGFFTPVFEPVKLVQNIQISSNSQITIENLEEIGYNNLDAEGVRRNGGRALSFSLLVNKENRSRVVASELIAKQLLQYGIKLTVVKVSYEEYLNRLKKGDFQLYLGEVKITENMDLSNLVIPGGSVAFGIKYSSAENDEATQNATVADIINAYYKGETAITDVVSVLQTEMPIIPLCYRTGVLFCKDSISNVTASSESDIYFSIQSYKLKQ